MRSLRATHTRHVPDGTLPLINIVLLLVLAFMIAGTIDTPLPDGFAPLQSSRAGPEPLDADSITIVVTQTGEISHSGDRIIEANLSALLASIAEEKGQLSIKADSRAPASIVINLLSDAEDARIKQAMVMTIEAAK